MSVSGWLVIAGLFFWALRQIAVGAKSARKV